MRTTGKQTHSEKKRVPRCAGCGYAGCVKIAPKIAMILISNKYSCTLKYLGQN